MFFHIDESGNSGNNLFDGQQQVLTYGVLSSNLNVDVLGRPQHVSILQKVASDSIHANELGMAGLTRIASELVGLQKRFDFRFDYYFIEKHSFAVVTLFNAVFDAGINEAMKWDWYWTPLRFPLLAALDYIVDEDILKESWRLCLVSHARKEREGEQISVLLAKILERLEGATEIHERMREVMRDALRYGIDRPLKMDFGIYSNTALSPNTIGFQFVAASIARRQKKANRKALGITLDRQTQFNTAQLETYEIQSRMAAALKSSDADRKYYLTHPFLEGVRDQATTMISHFPTQKVSIAASNQSLGLQLTDVYLWLVNRLLKGDEIPEALRPIVATIFRTGSVDGISLPAMMERWKAFEQQLPSADSLSDEVKATNQELIDRHRAKVSALSLTTAARE